MNIKHLALVLGAAALFASGGIGAVACSSSSSNNSSSSSGGKSSSGSSSGGTMDSGENDAGSSSGSGSGSGSGGSTGDDCGAKIPTLHPNPPGDVYCGYGPGDSGVTIECLSDAGMGWCCLGGSLGGGNYAPQICASNAAGCVADGDPDAGHGGSPIQCNQISDCPGNGAPGATACCLQGASEEACQGGFTKAYSGNAIVCEGDGGGAVTPCVAGEIQICSSAADCPTGMMCKPGKWKLFDIGFCQ